MNDYSSWTSDSHASCRWSVYGRLVQELVCFHEMMTLTFSNKPSGTLSMYTVYCCLVQELECLQDMNDLSPSASDPQGPCRWSVYSCLVQELECLQDMNDLSPSASDPQASCRWSASRWGRQGQQASRGRERGRRCDRSQCPSQWSHPSWRDALVWNENRHSSLSTPMARHRVSIKLIHVVHRWVIVQELCESRGDRPGLSVLTSLLVFVDVKLYWTMLRHWSQLVPNNYVNWHLRTLSNTTYLHRWELTSTKHVWRGLGSREVRITGKAEIRKAESLSLGKCISRLL